MCMCMRACVRACVCVCVWCVSVFEVSVEWFGRVPFVGKLFSENAGRFALTQTVARLGCQN